MFESLFRAATDMLNRRTKIDPISSFSIHIRWNFSLCLRIEIDSLSYSTNPNPYQIVFIFCHLAKARPWTLYRESKHWLWNICTHGDVESSHSTWSSSGSTRNSTLNPIENHSWKTKTLDPCAKCNLSDGWPRVFGVGNIRSLNVITLAHFTVFRCCCIVSIVTIVWQNITVQTTNWMCFENEVELLCFNGISTWTLLLVECRCRSRWHFTQFAIRMENTHSFNCKNVARTMCCGSAGAAKPETEFTCD